MLSNATNQPKSTVELGYMCPRGLSGPPANHSGEVIKMWYQKYLVTSIKVGCATRSLVRELRSKDWRIPD